MKFTSQIIKAAHAAAKNAMQSRAEGETLIYRDYFGMALRHFIKFGVTVMTTLKGSEKQITWAKKIIDRYTAARAVVIEKSKNAPAANQGKIMDALSMIDRNIRDNPNAGDIISRGGRAYFETDILAENVKSLMDAIRSIASGNHTVLSH